MDKHLRSGISFAVPSEFADDVSESCVPSAEPVKKHVRKVYMGRTASGCISFNLGGADRLNQIGSRVESNAEPDLLRAWQIIGKDFR